MAMLRSYLIKATYDWIIDHGFIPYALVDTEYEDVIVPKSYIDEDAKILLDLSPQAIENICISDEKVSFEATFDGEFMNVEFPCEAVLEFFSKETEQGLFAREFGYGINVNEGEDDEQANPVKINEKASSDNNILNLDF